MITNKIKPLNDIGKSLFLVENPIRYLGGEYGQIKKENAELTIALVFPDLYEIGMCNQAIKILYKQINNISGVRCERVFAPAPDFEAILKKQDIPLYTLESGIPLNQVDLIFVSLGYELGITGFLSILDTGKIPLNISERSPSDPLVVAGGPATTNPIPFSRFFNAVFIGEAEPNLFSVVKKLLEKKHIAKTKAEFNQMALEIFSKSENIWLKGKKAIKGTYTEFGNENDPVYWAPIPHIRVVQEHAAIEIMRGCPNGCRFCLAGIYYRPQRMKDFNRIIYEAKEMINKGGFREISLLSLSSGDYFGIKNLVEDLNNTFKHRHISFQLPSLRVNTFNLPLLEQLSEVRKGGLTFAVETPVDFWQLSLNKEVYKDKIIEILLEAKKRGWSKAKFYFMIGLPLKTKENQRILPEEQEIVNFLLDIQQKTKIKCHVNVGTFIPKAHTPYQWARQLSPEESAEKLDFIRKNLPRGKFQVSTHNPFVSFLEGILSRGDERVGELIEKAFLNGARLDAWDDQFKQEIWEEIFNDANFDVKKYVTQTETDWFNLKELPWKNISLGQSDSYLKKEFDKSNNQELTSICSKNCTHPCGICNDSNKITYNKDTETSNIIPFEYPIEANHPIWSLTKYRVIFSFYKRQEVAFISHLSLVEQFNKAFVRTQLPVTYTEGFNPVPRLELSSPLSMGVETEEEIASVSLYENILSNDFIIKMNSSLPSNLQITNAFIYPISFAKRRISLLSQLYGSTYNYVFEKDFDFSISFTKKIWDWLKENNISYSITSNILFIELPFKLDRKFRNLIKDELSIPVDQLCHIVKLNTFAKDEQNQKMSFFKLHEKISFEHKTFLETTGR